MLRFISDVQINVLKPEPEQIATIISNHIGNETVYDCGDLVENGMYLEQAEYDKYKQLFPFSVPVPGNHDYYDNLNGWVWDTMVDRQIGGVHIVGFDTGAASPENLQWLENKLNEESTYTILYMHHPLFSDNLRNGAMSSYIRSIYLPIIQNSKVDLVIAGHGHAYERHIFEEVTYLVIGGGGAPLDQVGISDTQIFSASEHHWLEILPSKLALGCSVKGLDDRDIDTFNVYNKNPNPEITPIDTDYEIKDPIITKK